GCDRIAPVREHDWNGCSCRLRRQRRGRATNRGDHGHLPLHQIGRQSRQSIIATFRPTVIDRDVLAFEIAGISQTLPEPGHKVCRGAGRPSAEEPDHRHRGLLRARRERPRGRAAKQRYELAPPHSITSSASESRLSEILMPSALAVFKLITVSNLVGCNTG